MNFLCNTEQEKNMEHPSRRKSKRRRSGQAGMLQNRLKLSINTNSRRFPESVGHLRDAFIKNGGVVLGRYGLPVAFTVQKTRNRHDIWEVLNCATTCTGDMFTLSLNVDICDGTVEYYSDDVLNIAKPAGKVADSNGSRVKMLFYSELSIGGNFDIIDHIHSFLVPVAEHKEHDWNFTRKVFETYYNVSTNISRRQEDKKNLLKETDDGTCRLLY
jgi:hypothetical protein